MRVSFRSFILKVPLSICLLAPCVYAGEIVVNDCNGGLLLWDTLENGAPFRLTVRVPSAAAVSSVVLIPSASGTEKIEGEVHGGAALFKDVAPGTYRICDGAGAAIAQVSVSGSAAPSAGYARLLGGVGMVGAVVGVSLAASSDSGNGTSTALPPSPDASLPSSPSDSNVTGAGTASKPHPCSAGTGRPGGVSISADDECGVNSSPEPISPYR